MHNFKNTLPESILFLSDNLTLDEKESKKRGNHKVKCSNFRNNIVILDIAIVTHWKLGSCIVNMHFLAVGFACCNVVKGIVHN